ncbi:COMPASS (complex proteins associated with Set1p) component [Ophidiomyces ophidiicola]|uniref:COMPASS (complex proteins associated with Set1p) component n=1 Tax=Ophidiomyces ophidiicola TaxID=1387563 RepID=UPI0020C37E89|nr:COMPASS (complex proteins associated with Set1p) component [Ophidiomyces ophidiicola]KAI1947812.1 COMPASS (complex proteins associated with Set1p) component [Ophidiomyces ophidiicola]KAI2046995.1 COMPASS (complex proteins associated with Set1p) component [Ophidiomyces ophidiicola]KAI2083158.1 COMPASS (complex proteins associated with Set1p) component [Ophidiomyces ophidiicola]
MPILTADMSGDMGDLLLGPSSGEEKKEASSVKVEEPSLNGAPPTANVTTDFPTPKKIVDLKQESVSRASSAEIFSPAPSLKTTPPVLKKETVRKPVAKKRKLNDADSIDSNAGSRRNSATPTSARAKSSTQRNLKQPSVSVAGSPAPEPKRRGRPRKHNKDVDGEDVDPSELFCICRKPDNHTWMIACDGGCEDWFHGKCVNMKQADADLIDKYICPNCEEKQGIRTTWKRMCRLPGCRKPARVLMKPPSKYCSDDHGLEFMMRKINADVRRSVSAVRDLDPTSRASSAPTNKGRLLDFDRVSIDRGTLHSNEAEDADEEYQDTETKAEGIGEHCKGGILTPEEVKAMADGVSSAEEFRNLGNNLLSAEAQELDSLRKIAESFRSRNEEPNEDIDLDALSDKIDWTPEERRQMGILKKQKDSLVKRSNILRDRDKFINLVRQHGRTALERLRQIDAKGWKDICGFDNRLSWSDEEFDDWRQSEAGQTALKDGDLYPDQPTDDSGDTAMTGVAEASDLDKIIKGVCSKKRCEQHRQWIKVQQQDMLFEQSMLRSQLAKCEKSATEVIEGIVLRAYGDRDNSMGGKD